MRYVKLRTRVVLPSFDPCRGLAEQATVQTYRAFVPVGTLRKPKSQRPAELLSQSGLCGHNAPVGAKAR